MVLDRVLAQMQRLRDLGRPFPDRGRRSAYTEELRPCERVGRGGQRLKARAQRPQLREALDPDEQSRVGRGGADERVRAGNIVAGGLKASKHLLPRVRHGVPTVPLLRENLVEAAWVTLILPRSSPAGRLASAA